MDNSDYEDTAAYREDVRQADLVRAHQAAKDHEEIMQQNQTNADADRKEVLQPLERGETFVRRTAIVVAFIVVFIMVVVGSIVYETSKRVIEVSEQNKALNASSQQALELLKSCVVPEDPGDCVERGQQGQVSAINQLICADYAYKLAFARLDTPRAEFPLPPPGCDPDAVLKAAEVAATTPAP